MYENILIPAALRKSPEAIYFDIDHNDASQQASFGLQSAALLAVRRAVPRPDPKTEFTSLPSL